MVSDLVTLLVDSKTYRQYYCEARCEHPPVHYVESARVWTVVVISILVIIVVVIVVVAVLPWDHSLIPMLVCPSSQHLRLDSPPY
jgi:hypothetical protein